MRGYSDFARVYPQTGRGEDWRAAAACRDEDPDLHFPVGSSGPALLQIAEAKAVCRRCPSIAPCLSWVLETGVDRGFGVWGGTSEAERQELRRGRRRSPIPLSPSDAIRHATEDLLAGATIDEVARRYGLSRNRAEELSAEVRRAKRAGVRP